MLDPVRQLLLWLSPCSVVLTPLAAQTPTEPPPARSQRIVRITEGSPTEAVSSTAFHQHGITPCGEQALLVPVTRATWPDATRKGRPNTQLELWRSDDGGPTWRKVATCAMERSGAGGIVAEPGGKVVHCVWSHSPKDFSSVYHQAFDTTTNQWLGKPRLVAKGVDVDVQYLPYDLEITADGTVVVCLGNGAMAQAPWRNSWASALSWLPSGAKQFATPVQINPDDTGCLGTIQVRGKQVATTYRTVRAGAVICLRWFDVTTGAPVSDAEPQVSAAGEGLQTNNGSAITIDDTGAITVLYVVGASDEGRGRMMIAHNADGSGTTWTQHELAEDAPLRGGNYNDCHFVLARGPGPQAVAYYTKLADQHRKLYRRLVDNGKPIGSEKVVAESDKITALTSLRSSVASSSVQVVITRTDKTAPFGEVVAYGLMPARNIWSAR